MKALKVILIVVLGVVAAVLIAGVFAPKNYSVTRSITIDAPVEDVFGQVNMFANFNNWSPWFELDTNQKVVIEGTDGEVGSKMTWTSEVKEVGSGSQEKIVVEQNSKVENTLRFDGFSMAATDSWELSENEDGSTEVTWGIRGDLDFVGSLFFLFSDPDKMMGPDFERGLANLKEYVENMEPVVVEQPIQVKTLESYPVLTIREKTTTDKIEETLGKLYGELMAELNKQALEQEGMPFATYHEWNPPTCDVEAGIATKSLGKKTARVAAYETGTKEVVYLSHFGSYESTEASHIRLNEWMAENNREAAGPPFEVYVTDPGEEPDPAKWQTDIYYPLK